MGKYDCFNEELTDFDEEFRVMDDFFDNEVPRLEKIAREHILPKVLGDETYSKKIKEKKY
ncbi:hypothetical protein ACFL1H_01950 [Nanoarchaeota archaeon]